MISRRWMWGVAGIVAALWVARAAHAENEADYFQGPYQAQPSAGVPQAARSAGRPAPVAAAAPSATRTKTRKPVVHTGYAAESARTATKLPPDERQAREFLRAAALRARFEVEAARLALQRAHSSSVRVFAAELMEDHEAADAELVHLLHARGMAQPMMGNPQRKVLNRMARLNGPRFDREFVENLGAARQREDLRRYERAGLAVNDPALRSWIDRQLPTLRQQQTSAAKLASWTPPRSRGG